MGNGTATLQALDGTFLSTIISSLRLDWHVPYTTDKLITLQKKFALTCLLNEQVLILSRCKHHGYKCSNLSSEAIICCHIAAGWQCQTKKTQFAKMHSTDCKRKNQLKLYCKERKSFKEIFQKKPFGPTVLIICVCSVLPWSNSFAWSFIQLHVPQ